MFTFASKSQQMKADIRSLEDIQQLVDTFYGRIRSNSLLGPVFAEKIQDWLPHLEKMYRFWQTILLEERTYSGSPFPPHARLPVGKEHFDEWLRLWHQTVDEHYEGDLANEAKWRADKMAVLFNFKIDYFRNNPGTLPLV